MGDNVEFFQAGDLVFLGSNIPHVWYNDDQYYKKKSKLRARAVVIYFNKEVFGPNFYTLHETQCLKQLYHKAERGMHITGSTNKQLFSLVCDMLHAKGMDRIICLLNILQVISNTKEYQLLAGIGYQNTYDTRDNQKIDEVFQYVSQNFYQEITLDDIAKRCHFTRQSFCRFFKKRTQKTFIDFLNEFRISHARKLLTETEDMSISEVAYQCGFNNISNFNKIFKFRTGITPKQYKTTMQLE